MVGSPALATKVMSLTCSQICSTSTFPLLLILLANLPTCTSNVQYRLTIQLTNTTA